MLLTDTICHTATIRIAAPARRTFEFLSDGGRLGDWSFGCWQTKQLPDGIFAGTSLLTGSPTFVRILADAARLQIDYAVGRSPDGLSPLIIARILPGALMGDTDTASFATLVVWRAAAPEERWRQICAALELETFRIRHLIESEHPV
jgi:hypothetical protein